MFAASLVLLALAAPEGMPSEAEVRAEARALLEPLCRGRCDVISVEMKRRRAGGRGTGAPGFDAPAPERLELSEIRLGVLFDAALEPSFRRFATERLEERLAELGAPVKVVPKVRPFPAPADPLEKPPEPVPEPPTEETPEPEPEAPVEAPAEAEPDWTRKVLERLLEFLPLFALFGLLAWLVLRLMRRMEDLIFDLRQPPPAPEPPAVTGELVEEPEGASTLPPPTVEEVASMLGRHRSSTRRVFRKLLLAGEHETVARAVALLGDGVVRDLARDPDTRVALLASGERTAEVLREPMTDEDRDLLLRVIQAEMMADRVAHRGEDVRPELEPLLGWSPETFVRFVEDLGSPDLVRAALRNAPPNLSDAYLRGLDDRARAALVLDLMQSPPSRAEDIEALAERITLDQASAEVGGWEADHLVDLVDALPSEAQDELIEELARSKPELLRRNLGRLPVETALTTLPEPAIEAAWAKVPLEGWLAYLRGAPAPIADRCLALCPARLRAAVTEELSLRVPVDRDAAREARRRIVRAALDASEQPRLGPG